MSRYYTRDYGRDWFPIIVGAFIALIVVIVVAAILSPIIYVAAIRHSAHYETFTVQDRQRGSDETPYLVYTDKGVRSVEDSISFFTWNSSDRWAALKVHHTYNCKIAGWRKPFLSWYPNVIGPCKEVH